MTATTERTQIAAAEPQTPWNLRAVQLLGRYGTPAVFVILIVIFSVMEGSRFFSGDNLRNVLVQSTISLVIALGLTFVLIAGEFDMSIGYTASFCGMLTAMHYGGSAGTRILMLLIVLLVGAAIGIVNGIVVAKLGVNALVGTLGVGSLVVGLNYLITNGVPVSLPSSGTNLVNLYLKGIGPISWPIILSAIVVIVMWLIANRTTYGLELRAVGGNRVAAGLSGIRLHRVVILAFVLSGMLAAAGGILISANVGSGQVTGGDGYLLTSFAACYLGSAALRDGEFHIIGTVLGVLTIAVVNNGLAIKGVSNSAQYLVQGGLLIAAVGTSTAARRLSVGRRGGGA